MLKNSIRFVFPLFLCLLLLRRIIEPKLYDFFGIYGYGWKEFTIFCLYILAHLTLWKIKNLKGRLLVVSWMLLIDIYALLSFNVVTAIYNISLYGACIAIMINILYAYKDPRHVKDLIKIINLIFIFYILVSLILFFFDNVAVRNFLGITIDIQTDEECIGGACIRYKNIFLTELIQYGGLIFEPFTNGFISLISLGFLLNQGKFEKIISIFSMANIVFGFVRTIYVSLCLYLLASYKIKIKTYLIIFGTLFFLILFLDLDMVKMFNLSDESTYSRYEAYKKFIPDLITGHPFGFNFDNHYASHINVQAEKMHVGESFLSSILSSMGILGVISYVGLILSVGTQAYKISKSSGLKLLTDLFLLFVVIHIACLFLGHLFERVTSVFLWTIISVVIAYERCIVNTGFKT